MPTQIQTPWGEPVVFPDGVPDDEMLSALDSLAMDRQNRAQFQSLPPIAQAMTQVFSDFTGQQEPYQIPTIPGNTFGMTTQDMAQVRGTIQQTQQLNAGEMIRQRVEREKQMEAEKDRAQQLKLEEARFNNQMRQEKFRMKQLEEAEKRKAERGEVVGTPGTGMSHVRFDESGTPQIRTLAEPAQRPAAPMRPMSVPPNATVIDPQTGRTIFTAPPAVSKPQIYNVGGSLVRYNPETGTTEKLTEAQQNDFNAVASIIARLGAYNFGPIPESTIVALETQFPHVPVRELAGNPESAAPAAEAARPSSGGGLISGVKNLFGFGGEEQPAPTVVKRKLLPDGRIAVELSDGRRVVQ